MGRNGRISQIFASNIVSPSPKEKNLTADQLTGFQTATESETSLCLSSLCCVTPLGGIGVDEEAANSDREEGPGEERKEESL